MLSCFPGAEQPIIQKGEFYLGKNSDEHWTYLHCKQNVNMDLIRPSKNERLKNQVLTFSLSISIAKGSVDPGGTTATEAGPLATSAITCSARCKMMIWSFPALMYINKYAWLGCLLLTRLSRYSDV